jgi:hypothetical protein
MSDDDVDVIKILNSKAATEIVQQQFGDSFSVIEGVLTDGEAPVLFLGCPLKVTILKHSPDDIFLRCKKDKREFEGWIITSPNMFRPHGVKQIRIEVGKCTVLMNEQYDYGLPETKWVEE